MHRTLPLVVVAAMAFSACAGEPAAETAAESAVGTAPIASASPNDTAPPTPTPTAAPTAVTNPAETSATPAPAGTTAPAPSVPEVLRFTAPLVGGGELDLASLAGQRVLLWFWAPG